MSSDARTNGSSSPIYRIAKKVSLESSNSRWRDILEHSLLLKPFLAIANLLAGAKSTPLPRIGTLLQRLSFGLSLLLFVLVGMHNFVEDKYKLAIVVLVSLALFILGRLMQGEERRAMDAYDGVVLAYFAANIVAAFASHYFAPSLKGLSKVAVFIASYFLFTANLNGSMKRKLFISTVAIATGTALSLYGLYQYKIGVAPLATWEDPTIESSGTRIFATLDNPNLLAGFLVPLVPLSLGISLGWLERRSYLVFAAFLAVSALIGVATLLTGSRGGMLGLIAGVGAILYIGTARLWKKWPGKRAFILGGIAILLGGAVVAATTVPFVSQRFESIFAGREHSSNAYRMNVYASSFKMFKDSWWIGCGPGNETFRLAYGLYMVSSYDALGTYCVPLEVAVETGVPGLAAFALLILCALSRGHLKFWKNGEAGQPEINPLSRWMAGAAAAAVIAMMIHGLGDTVFYRPQVHFLFWLIVAILISEDTPKPGVARDNSISPS